MFSSHSRRASFLRPLVASLAAIGFVLCGALVARAADLAVTSTSPTLNGFGARTTNIVVNFDKAVKPSSIDASSFRVFGRGTGTVTGTFAYTNSNQTLTFTPSKTFSAGEVVSVNLSHDVEAGDNTTLRSAGYAFQFTVSAVAGASTFTFLNAMSNRTSPGSGTRIYGAQATDLNGDGWLDLATVNEDSGDVRVLMNIADGSGLYGAFLSPEAIGDEASPNEPADFDNDGKTDGVFSATSSEGVWILRGNGDGTYGGSQSINLGGAPHGVAVLDVDGDGDWDIVDANVSSNNLALMLNDGNGNFGAATTFDGGVDGEYGLTSGDMNNDGIMDLIVGARNGEEIRTLLGDGDGTFTQAALQDSGGLTWVVQVGDLNGDGDLDASVANSTSNNGAILFGNGDGTFDMPVTYNVGAHTPSTDLADLDGDGDLDWILSSFGGGFWNIYLNNGSGTFAFDQQIDALNNPSCAVPVDFDNDGDIDLALTDEIADVVTLMENTGFNIADPEPSCAPTPMPCRTPSVPGKASVQIQKNANTDTKDKLQWKWIKGAVTPKTDFGNPTTGGPGDGFDLCIYDNGALAASMIAPPGGLCASNKPCWKEKTTGFDYNDKDLTPDGIQKVIMRAGTVAGKAKVQVKGAGASLDIPTQPLTGPVDVQLRRRDDGVCFGSHFSTPFTKNDGLQFKDKAD